jgi:hypothetical protein
LDNLIQKEKVNFFLLPSLETDESINLGLSALFIRRDWSML